MDKRDKGSFVEKDWEERAMEGKCPLIKEPYESCYCTLLSSNSVGKTVYYCGSHYKECKIYKKHLKGE
ncbi:MAG: hypothetical protein IME96_08815 [Proteobacteria bacterium]|nr:hypothetical protein [Pseudomonadota bacterium]